MLIVFINLQRITEPLLNTPVYQFEILGSDSVFLLLAVGQTFSFNFVCSLWASKYEFDNKITAEIEPYCNWTIGKICFDLVLTGF